MESLPQMSEMRKIEEFKSFWHGEELGPLQWACIASFLRRGHRFTLYCYEDVHVPDGTVVKNAHDVLPREFLLPLQDQIHAFSDLFRYKLLYDQGGWWVDTDVLRLTVDFPTLEFVFAEEEDGGVSGGHMRFPAHHPAMECAFTEALEIGRNEVWGQSGPVLFDRILERFDLKRFAVKTTLLYPINWAEAFKLWLPQEWDAIEKRCKNAPWMHMWGSMFKRLGVDLLQKPPEGSYLDRLFHQYPFHKPLIPATASDYQRTVDAINNFMLSILEDARPLLHGFVMPVSLSPMEGHA